MSVTMKPLLNDQDEFMTPKQTFEMETPSTPDIMNRDRQGSVMNSVNLTRTLSMQLNEERQTGESTNKAGIPGCIFNYTNSIIGAGIIGLPYALKIAGFFYGIFLLIGVAILIDYGVRSLIECGLIKDKKDYELLVEYLFGKSGYYAVTIFMFLFAYGAMIAYHVVIGDAVQPLIVYATQGTDKADSIYTERWFIITIFSIIFMLPLSLLKNMSALSHTSGISITAVLVIVFTVCIEAPLKMNSGNVDTNKGPSFIRYGFFEAIGTMSFAFVCHIYILYISLYTIVCLYIIGLPS